MMGIYIVFVTMLTVATAYSPEEWKEIFGRVEEWKINILPKKLDFGGSPAFLLYNCGL